MALPKIEHPILSIEVQSLGREVKFRPFLVKEEKLLLIAKESKDFDDIRTAVLQIIQNCCVEDEIDVLGSGGTIDLLGYLVQQEVECIYEPWEHAYPHCFFSAHFLLNMEPPDQKNRDHSQTVVDADEIHDAPARVFVFELEAQLACH